MAERVNVREVGPRDGFQNEPEVIATADKVRLIEMLARTGLTRLEVTSFVRADVIPQLADAPEVLSTIDVPDGVSLSVLIPNERRLIGAGAQEIGFGDTTGMANPAQVREFFPAAREALGDEVELTAHFHNTRGQGLANVLSALDAGVRSFESSFGELGGCPVPKGATGNIATEDLVCMLHEMGLETGISLERLIEAARAAQEVLGRPLGSHVLTAGPVQWKG